MLPKDIKNDTVITRDHIRIAFDHYINNHSKVIILAHGFYNSKNAVLFKDMAEALNDEYDVICFDYRGHGNSSGWFTWSAREANDLEAIIKYAKEHYSKIGVIGFSMGAAASLIYSAEYNDIDALIAVSAPSEFRRINLNIFRMGIMENVIYNIFQEGRIGKGVRPGSLWHKKTSPISIINRINIPTLFIHGKKDWLIYPTHSEKLYEAARCEKQLDLIDEATHAEYIYRRNRDDTIARFKKWFKLHL